MSKFEKYTEAAKFVVATSIAALGTQGCASECELNPDTPVLEDPIAFCDANRHATITCLQTEDKGDKLECSAINLRCNEPLEKDVNKSDYCVEGDAKLEANY